jgi:O-antigen ligase
MMFALLTLGVLEPKLDVLNFNQITLRSVVAEASPNPYHQLIWVAVAAFASLGIMTAPARLRHVAFTSWPLLLLMAYCLLSATWSNYPEISLRRSFGLIVPAYCLLVAITYMESAKRAAIVIYLAFWVTLLTNLAVLPLPAAFDEHGLFRGVTGQKNLLGSIGGLAIMFGVGLMPLLEGSLSRALCILYFIGWFTILVLSGSKTSLGLVILVPTAFFLLMIASRILRLHIGLVAIGVVALTSTAVAISYYGPGYGPIDLVQLVLPDATFSGRTALWSFMISEIGDKSAVGTGFGSFWGVGYDAPNLSSIYTYIQRTNQAHNGYLDVIGALGVIGLVLLGIVVLHFAAAAERLVTNDVALSYLIWLIVLFSLFHNTMESSLLVPFNPVWHLTLFAICVGSCSVAKSCFSRPCIRAND